MLALVLRPVVCSGSVIVRKTQGTGERILYG